MKISNSLKLKAAAIAIALSAIVIPATSQAAMLYRQLELGMSGSDVSSLQAFLATDATIYPQGLVTGYFGLLTKAAVSAFQLRNGISVVGRVGPITMAAINAQMNSDIYAPVISGVSVSTAFNAATLSWNSSENASASVYFSAAPITMLEASAVSGVVISGSNVVANTSLNTSHSAYVAGLQPNTVYNYVLYVRDAAGNETITLPATFKTL